MGFDENLIVNDSISKNVMRNRTYATAVALNEWIENSGLDIKSFNLVTLSCHARRSRILFEKAFKDKIKIGIIAEQNKFYDHKQWWKTSKGFRDVMNETIAYLYAWLFFHP